MKTLLHSLPRPEINLWGLSLDFLGVERFFFGKVWNGIEYFIKNQFLLFIMALPCVFWKGFFEDWAYL